MFLARRQAGVTISATTLIEFYCYLRGGEGGGVHLPRAPLRARAAIIIPPQINRRVRFILLKRYFKRHSLHLPHRCSNIGAFNCRANRRDCDSRDNTLRPFPVFPERRGVIITRWIIFFSFYFSLVNSRALSAFRIYHVSEIYPVRNKCVCQFVRETKVAERMRRSASRKSISNRHSFIRILPRVKTKAESVKGETSRDSRDGETSPFLLP